MADQLRMSAYYYSFEPTGDARIDRILSAVACAGKAFHSTAAWCDDAGTSYPGHVGATPIEWIQNAADDAAGLIVCTACQGSGSVERERCKGCEGRGKRAPISKPAAGDGETAARLRRVIARKVTRARAQNYEPTMVTVSIADLEALLAASREERGTDEAARLLRFAGHAIDATRGSRIGNDWGGGDVQESLEACGLIEGRVVSDRCGADCECDPGDTCYFETALGRRARASILAHALPSTEDTSQ